MNLSCEWCGMLRYSASPTALVRDGARCDCGGPLQVVAPAEPGPSAAKIAGPEELRGARRASQR
jgi:hypothetical protein